MRILFFADNFPPERNAQASRVFERAAYWVEWGHEVTVVTCAPNFPEGVVFPGYRNQWRSEEVMDGIRVVRVKTLIAANSGTVMRMVDYLSFLLPAVLAGLREPAPDVVAATSPQMFAAVAGWATAASKRRPFLLEVSDLWPESVVAVGAMRKNPVVAGLEGLASLLYRKATRIVLLTEAFRRKLIAQGVAAEKLDVVRNGVDLRRYSPRPKDAALAAELGLSAGDFVVGYIGTLGMAHGLGQLLEAAERLRGGRVRFLLVGPGAERATLMEQAARRKLDNVVFVGAQPKNEMPRYWSLCDVALVHLKNTPLFETVVPSKMFEAMGMGLAMVMVSPRGEASEILTDEGAGIWVPSGDLNGLVETIELLAGNPDKLRLLAQNSQLAAARHSREQQARGVLDSLARAVGVEPVAVVEQVRSDVEVEGRESTRTGG